MRAIVDIIGTKSWELRIVGEVPPGMDDVAVVQIVMSNIAMMLAIAPQVRGQTCTVHKMGVQSLMQLIEAQQRNLTQ